MLVPLDKLEGTAKLVKEVLCIEKHFIDKKGNKAVVLQKLDKSYQLVVR